MKKIIVAADSFKGSLSSTAVASAVERGVHAVFPACEVRKVVIADGGEGTVGALVASLGGRIVTLTVSDPLMRPVEARYGVVDDGTSAVIEMAAASGLPLLTAGERNPLKTTTYGTGEMIAHALRAGCRRFLVGIGGSATNDAGTGMLAALGFRFLDAAGNALPGCGESLGKIETIDVSGMAEGLAEAQFTVACDVTNPFAGPTGAAYIFAPQKGADAQMVSRLDDGMHRFATVLQRYNGTDVQALAGAGAAGGLGGGFAALLGARLVPGLRMVLDALGFDALLQGADLVITGEGKLDAQTAMGKAPRGVLDAAAAAGVPVVAIGGAVEQAAALNAQGFAAVLPILPGPATLAEAMEPGFAAANIERTVTQVMNLFKTRN